MVLVNEAGVGVDGGVVGLELGLHLPQLPPGQHLDVATHLKKMKRMKNFEKILKILKKIEKI